MLKFLIKGNRLFMITAVIFIVLVLFIDKNNLLDSWAVRRKINDLEEQKEYYLNKIKEDSTVLESLKDDRYLEKLAREQYYMRKEGETLYIVK